MTDSKSEEIFNHQNKIIAIIGLGYVGLPLAVEFGKTRTVIGFDVKAARIAELKQGQDHTLEVTPEALAQAKFLTYTDSQADLATAQIFIITVPTPIDQYKRPDLKPLLSASKTVGTVLKKGDVVIYESTVYPGCTEEDCVPVLEQASGLRFNEDFFCGYSPERVNPGDPLHRLTTIVKVTSGSTPAVAAMVDALYREIIQAGTHPAASIRVAEAAKVIENTQRDVNIALINELAIIFNKLNIDSQAVLEAAGSKWNFLPFRPGLVGGHCIGVDPYYLTHKAQALGFHPEMILAGRRTNDQMGIYVAAQLLKAMGQRRLLQKDSKVLIMGLTFKENCPDLRNTRVVDIIQELSDYGLTVEVYDPWADAQEALAEYQLTLEPTLKPKHYDAIVLAVAHKQFKALAETGIRALGKENHVLYDLKYVLPQAASDLRL